MRNKDIKRNLCIRPGASPEDALKLALSLENWPCHFKVGLVARKRSQKATILLKQPCNLSYLGNPTHSGQNSTGTCGSDRNQRFLYGVRNYQKELTELKLTQIGSKGEFSEIHNRVIFVVTVCRQTTNNPAQLQVKHAKIVAKTVTLPSDITLVEKQMSMLNRTRRQMKVIISSPPIVNQRLSY